MKELKIEISSKYNIEMESEMTARKKLEILLAPDFYDYGIRFASLGEYVDMMETHIKGRGIFYDGALKKSDGGRVSFAQYKDKGQTGGWAEIAAEQTDWPPGALKMRAREYLMALLNDARKEGKNDKPSNEVADRAAVLTAFRDKLIQKILIELPSEDEYFWRHEFLGIAHDYKGFNNFLQDSRQKLEGMIGDSAVAEELLNADIIKQKKVRDLFPDNDQKVQECLDLIYRYQYAKQREALFKKEDLELAEKWFKDPASVDLREFINVVMNNQGNEHADQSEQYDLALVVDKKAIEIDSPNGITPRGWGNMIPGRRTDTDLLGVIGTLPGKELLQQIIDTSSKAGAKSHPVFSHDGNTRYPVK